jgi:hypothetical protein
MLVTTAWVMTEVGGFIDALMNVRHSLTSSGIYVLRTTLCSYPRSPLCGNAASSCTRIEWTRSGRWLTASPLS